MSLDLVTAAFPEDPVLDVALSHALLLDVAAGRRPATLRIFRPGPAVAFGRLDAINPRFARASALARERGFAPLVRSVGGHAAVFDGGAVIAEQIVPAADVTAGLQERFEAASARLAAVLADLGADARIGELPGEYCAGAHSIHVGGRKVAGIGQRAVRGGANTSAVVVVEGGARVRETVAAVYAALGLDVDPATAGSLDEALAGVTVEDVQSAIRAAHPSPRPVEPDAALLERARALAARHEAP
jgi:lipoate-protein ligase A